MSTIDAPRPGLHIPDIHGATALTAALAYASAGWYVLPTSPHDPKNPGSVVRERWHEKSTRDAEKIKQWWVDHPDRGIALHVGKSSAVGFDYDREVKPDDISGEIWRALQTGAVQRTRKNENTARCHYFFSCEPDEFSNSANALPSGFDVRCHNGVLIVEPTPHPDAKTKNAEYRWRNHGAVPPLPGVLRKLLNQPRRVVNDKTPADLEGFLAQYDGNSNPEKLKGPLTKFRQKVDAGSGRHDAARDMLRWGFSDARADLYPAKKFYDQLESLFYEVKPEAFGTGEFERAAMWAIAASEKDDPKERQPKYEPPMLTDFKTEAEAEAAEPEAPGSKGKFAARLLTRSALKKLPNPKPLLTNIVDQGTTALLYGKWGTGKSFIALDWSMCVATGKTWQTRTAEQRKVLYVAAEGAHGIKLRVNAWEKAWSNRVCDDWFHVLPIPVNLTNPTDISEIVALVKNTGYGMVVFDTLARCMVGADENSAKDAGIVINTLTEVKEATADGMGLVLGVHHTGKDAKTLRGSSAFEGGVDTVYYTNVENGGITLEREKRKDGPVDDVHRLRIEPVDGTESAVVSVSGADGLLTRAERVSVIFRQNFGQTGADDAALRTLVLAAGMSESTYARGRDELLKDGRLVNTGTAKKKYLVARPTA